MIEWFWRLPQSIRSTWDHAVPQGGVVFASAVSRPGFVSTVLAGIIVATFNVWLKRWAWREMRAQTIQDEKDSQERWRKVRQVTFTPDPDRPR